MGYYGSHILAPKPSFCLLWMFSLRRDFETAFSSGHRSWLNTVGQWMKRPGLEVLDSDELAAYAERWALKWKHYCEMFPAEEQRHFDRMSEEEIQRKAAWFESDFTRITKRVAESIADSSDCEVVSGRSFVFGLIEECHSNVVHLQSSTSTPGPVASERLDTLKKVDRYHTFCLRVANELLTMTQLARRMPIPSVSQTADDVDIDTQALSVQGGSGSFHSGRPPESPNDTWSFLYEGGTENGPIHLADMPTDTGITLSQRPPGQVPTLRYTLPDLRRDLPAPQYLRRQYQPPPQPQAATVALSSAQSHRTNINILLGVSFFGASITWSTVFASTRGDMVLTSWSASLFIIGTSSASSASILLSTDEDIVEKYIAVRWTVRVLSVIAIAHILGGIIMIGVVFLILDVDMQEPTFHGGKKALQAAGCYAIVLSVILVVVGLVIRRRYTTRTWFR
ncbi:hypothetical protein BDZ89DRAFT_1164928 [Hymenopellis radicata]|nr:hypothetical protein BDZ89DRAFT_1164928 [Hymenopellis radicata]